MKITTFDLLQCLSRHKTIAIKAFKEQPKYKGVRGLLNEKLLTLEELAYITSMPTEDGTDTLVSCTELGAAAMTLYKKHKARCTLSVDPHADAGISDVLLKLANMPNIKSLTYADELPVHERNKSLFYSCQLEAKAAVDEGIPHRYLWIYSLKHHRTFEEYPDAPKALERAVCELPPNDAIVLIVQYPDLITSYLQSRFRLPPVLWNKFFITDKYCTDLKLIQSPKISPFGPEISEKPRLSFSIKGIDDVADEGR
mgnify:CR=1 FL=1